MKMECNRCRKRLTRKTARQVDGEVLCSPCMFGNSDRDATRSAETACPAPVPQDSQARAEGIALPTRPNPTEY